jgi:hypothetical protein
MPTFERRSEGGRRALCIPGWLHPRALGVTVRPLAPAERDAELAVLTGTIVAALAGWCWLKAGLPWPHCWWRHAFGLPCPLCGSTRSALALSNLEFSRAFHCNPLSTCAYLAVGVYDCYAVTALSLPGRWRVRLSARTVQVEKTLLVAGLIGLAVNWAYLLLCPRG